MRLITNPEEFEAKLREAQALEAEQFQPKQKELEHVMSLLSDTEYEAEQIAQTVNKIKGIVGEKLQAQSVEVDRRYQALQARKMTLEQELDQELTESSIDNLLDFREAVAIGLNDPTPEERRKWLELLHTQVTVSKGIAVVTCRLGGVAQYDLFTGFQISASGI